MSLGAFTGRDCLIGGEWRGIPGDPSTGATLGQIARGEEAEIYAAARAAAEGEWGRAAAAERAARQLRLARRLRAGQVFLNNDGAGGGVELPFGGVGPSGQGREKGFEALYGFTCLKTVAALHG